MEQHSDMMNRPVGASFWDEEAVFLHSGTIFALSLSLSLSLSLC